MVHIYHTLRVFTMLKWLKHECAYGVYGSYYATYLTFVVDIVTIFYNYNIWHLTQGWIIRVNILWSVMLFMDFTSEVYIYVALYF